MEMCFIVSFWDTSLSTCHISRNGIRKNLLEWRHLLCCVVCNLQQFHFFLSLTVFEWIALCPKWFYTKTVFTEYRWCSFLVYCWKFASIAPLNHINKITLYCLDKVNNISEKLYTGNVTWIEEKSFAWRKIERRKEVFSLSNWNLLDMHRWFRNQLEITYAVMTMLSSEFKSN